MKEKRKMNKHAQVAIFIIIAILIVVALLVLLFFPEIKMYVVPSGAPEYIRDCTEQATEEALEKVEVQGGSLDPENYILYKDNKVDYVCYTEAYYQKCVMQKPFLKQEIEQEIESYIQPKIKDCFENMKSQLERGGSSVSTGGIQTDVVFVPNSVIVTIRAPTTIRKEGALSFEKFKVDVDSQIYDLVILSSSISNYEARYGDSDTLPYMMYYPEIKVEKIERQEGRVYILTHKPTQEKFMFASRSVAFPSGYIN